MRRIFQPRQHLFPSVLCKDSIFTPQSASSCFSLRHKISQIHPPEAPGKEQLEQYSKLSPKLVHFSQLQPTPVDGSRIFHTPDPEKMNENSCFLRHEIPIRLARGVTCFQNLPFVFAVNPYIYSVYLQCWEWFEVVADMSPDATQEEVFGRLLRLRNVGVLRPLSIGICQIRRHPNADLINFDALDRFLGYFCTHRAAWRCLVDHHLSLKRGKSSVFNPHCRPKEIAQMAAAEVKNICLQQYGIAPECVITGDNDCTLHFIDDYLKYLMVELIKNSMRATVEYHASDVLSKNGATDVSPTTSVKLPPIRIEVCSGSDVTIKVCDAGGGINPAHFDNVMKFGWTTAQTFEEEMPAPEAAPAAPHQYFPGFSPPRIDPHSSGSPMLGKPMLASHIAGYGFGLPLTRCFLKQFGGSLTLYNMPGYGLDVLIRLSRTVQENFLCLDLSGHGLPK